MCLKNARYGGGSLTLKLVVLYTITSSSIIIIACALIYFILVDNINREHDKFFQREINGIVKLVIDPFVNEKKIQLRLNQDINASHDEYNGLFHSSSSHYAYFRVINRHANYFIETDKMTALFPERVYQGSDLSYKYYVKYKVYDGRVFLILKRRVSQPGNNWEVHGALNITQDEEVLLQYKRMFVFVSALGILFSTLAGLWVTKRGLLPLNEINKSIQAVTINHLHHHISSRKWPKELTQLAISFDEMLDRLEQSVARLSQFSGDLAHELRTPINNLMGETEVALSLPRSKDEYLSILESNMEEFSRLNRMIDELLFLSRAEDPGAQINIQEIDLNKKIHKICSFYEGVAAEKNIKFYIHGNAKALADPVLLQRLLNNLISNAINYSNTNTKICFLVRSTEKYAEIQIKDEGIGISNHELNKVFDRFYRADKARVKNTQGTGLGLSLVKSIMDLHHGSIIVKSKVNKGTVFILKFPC